MKAAFEIRGITVAYRRPTGSAVVVVRDVDIRLEPGQIVGLAGESGSGKSTTALAAMGFPIPGSERLDGSAKLGELDLLRLSTSSLRSVWGRDIAYVAQDATLALNPIRRIGGLIAEPLVLHLGLKGSELRARSIDLLDSVGIPDPDLAVSRYPFQFSGGQQQRIALAIALACEPQVLVLDEPTTGLDVTTQAQIASLIRNVVTGSQTAALYISHDLALLATICDDIAIMYAGEIMERGAAKDVYTAARHPYAAALIDAVPTVDEGVRVAGIPGLPPMHAVLDACPFAERCGFVIDRCVQEHPDLVTIAPQREVRCLRTAELGIIPRSRQPVAPASPRSATHAALLAASDLLCSYRGRQRNVAVDGVSLEIAPGETLGVVGESGSGKSTLLRALAGLHPPESGTMTLEGRALPPRAVKRPRVLRQAIQIVFQNPESSLNPRHTVARLLERPLRLFRSDLDARGRRRRMFELLAGVQLDSSVLNRFPSQLSGGQKQRVALARAFAAEPKVILCDEVVSALDVSVQASILELLAKLSAEHNTALLFVTHDLAVVRSIADRICVMHAGRFCEVGTTAAIFESPADPYTRELLSAVPRPRERFMTSREA